MIAKVEDLKKGDTVIVALGSHLAEVKLLRQPQLAKYGKKLTWYGKPKWTTVLCALRHEVETGTTSYNRAYTIERPVIADGKEYNKEKRIDFTGKTAWIIKREQK